MAVANVPAGNLSAGVGLAYVVLGQAYAEEGRSDDARSALRSAVAHLDPTVGPDHPESVRARELLARF